VLCGLRNRGVESSPLRIHGPLAMNAAPNFARDSPECHFNHGPAIAGMIAIQNKEEPDRLGVPRLDALKL